MSEQSPYASPQAQQHPPFPPQQATRSNAPKVFGIIHIIYAVLGIVMSLVGLASLAFTDKMLELGGIHQNQQLNEYMSVVDKLAPYTYLDTAVKITLGVLLLTSGIKLLKYQSTGLKLSNLWSITRILWLIIFTALTYSINQEIQQASIKLNPETAGFQSNLGSAMMIFIVVVYTIYPIVSYLLLNRDNVKKDLV